MADIIFITHPDVQVDPTIPIPRWRLADRGIARMRAFAARSEMPGLFGQGAG